MTGRYVILCPLHDAPGGDVETVLRERADTLAAKRAAGTASYDELAALDALRNVLGSDGCGAASEPSPEPPLLLTQREVGRLLGVSLSTVEALIRDGSIPALRIGKSVRVVRDALLLWIEAQASDRMLVRR